MDKDIFKSKSDIINFAKSKFAFIKAGEDEIIQWPYKSELIFSIRNLAKFQIFKGRENNVDLSISFNFLNYKFINKKIIVILNDNSENVLSSLNIKMICPFSNEIKVFNLHPTRGGLHFFTKGYYINESTYKNLYYKTDEYLSKFRNTLTERYSENGEYLKSPINSKTIKEKIKATMNEKYGCDWFLIRGQHYNKILRNIYKKYGNDAFSFLGVSKLEISIINELISSDILFSDELYYFDVNNNKQQYSFKLDENSFTLVDFYDKKNNLVIEIYGDYFHCNPKVNHITKNLKGNSSAIQKELDEIKNNIIKDRYNCKIYIIWESDWLENKQSIINSIRKIVNES